MKNNPTCHLKQSKLWGFEVNHIVFSVGLMMISNLVFSALNMPVFGSWVIGVGTLLTLKIGSIGKKAGHLQFLLQFIAKPRVHLGCTFRSNQRKATNDSSK